MKFKPGDIIRSERWFMQVTDCHDGIYFLLCLFSLPGAYVGKGCVATAEREDVIDISYNLIKGKR
jgi:hypothetical protein